jgi:urease accessory protein
MGWHGHLSLHYRRDGERTVGLDRHHGPLRVLKPLYPEGPGVCHHVLVHPPGGLVGGDTLEVALQLQPHTHALLTTPGATRLYRSAGAVAEQAIEAEVADGARLEWLPLETIAYPGCDARNRLRFKLAPGAQMLGWDVLALGLPAAGQPLGAGRVLQHIELPGTWLERAHIDGTDALLDSPLGWDGRRVLATLWFAAGGPLPEALRDSLLEGAREAAAAHPLARHAGCSAPQPPLVVLRVLAERVEPALALLTQVRARWRQAAWHMQGVPPRIWKS